MTMLNLEVAVSCCSGLIEMVHNVSVLSLRRHFSPPSFPFYSLIPAVPMPLAWSSESLGEINSWLHILWKLWYHMGSVGLSWAYTVHSFSNSHKHYCACKHAATGQMHIYKTKCAITTKISGSATPVATKACLQIMPCARHCDRQSKNSIFFSNDCGLWSVPVRGARWRSFAKYNQLLKWNMKWCSSPRGKVPYTVSHFLL